MLTVSNLTVNYLADPTAVDRLPKFSYTVNSTERGDGQAYWRIRVENVLTGELVWDTGVTAGEQKLHIPYEGAMLLPVTEYEWTATVISRCGERAEASARFITGKLDERWRGIWITGHFIRREADAFAAPYLRRTFSVSKPVRAAFLSICGLGYFRSYINGERTGDDCLSPAFTRYDATDMYCQYDVKKLLKEGENCIACVLGNGWYNCFAEDPWNTRQASWRHWPKMLAELKIVYADGDEERIVTDPEWRSSEGPIFFNGIRNGEHYDARRELGEWTKPGYDDGGWKPARRILPPGGELIAMEMEPIRVRTEIAAKKMWKTKNGYGFDIGQNQAGVGLFRFRGPRDTEITIRYSDVLKDGEIDQGPIGGFIRSHGFQTDKYIKATDGEEVWSPIFVYHGFQYIELIGLTYEPKLSDVTALTYCSDVADIGRFSCSNELLNKLQHLCRWSSISNMESIPTDCPHREKNGWTGDSSMSSEQMMMNFGSAAFFTKWSGDMKTALRPAGTLPCVVPSTGWGYNSINGPDWSSALVNVPYNIWLYNNDEDILKYMYSSIKRNCDYMESMTTDYTLCYGLGDWCAPFEGPAISANMGSFKCPTEVTDTAFFYNAAKLVEKISKILNLHGDAEYYGALKEKIRTAFRENFFDKETFTVKGDCQTSTAVMLYFGMYERDEYEPLVAKLIEQIHKCDDHVDFGLLGCKFVMNALGAAGEGNLGHRMLSQETYPGCRRWIDLGATTLWECWNGGGSHNHHMFSDLSSFLYKYVAGICPSEEKPGFRLTVMRPAVDCGMESASASHLSPYGEVSCHWSNRNGTVCISVKIPFGCEAELYLPAHYDGRLYENGEPLSEVMPTEKVKGVRNEELKITLASGEYMFETAEAE